MSSQPAPQLTISDTALLRWLERSGALDAEAMKGLLAKSLNRAWQAARALSQSEVIVVVDGLAYIIKGDTVVTVLNDRGRFLGRTSSGDGSKVSE